jgi:hypothetical protein
MVREEAVEDKARALARNIGAFLVVGGGVALLYLAYALVQVVTNPAKSPLVEWLVSGIGEGTFVLNGHMGEQTFEIQSSEHLQYIALAILGLIMVSILVKVVKALISGGIKLITFSGSAEKINTD